MMYINIRVVLVSLSISLVCSLGPAGEPPSVKLMRPDSLAGWDHGDPSPHGWTIAAGRLSGAKDSTPLLSGFTAGDCELRLRWSVSDGGALKIAMPEVPAGDGLELILREGNGCGRLTDGGILRAAGAKVGPLDKGTMHTAAVRRAGGKLSLVVDDKLLWTVDVAPGRRFGLGLAVPEGKATLSDPRWAEPPGEPLPIGKDLTGWWTDGKQEAWGAEGDELVLVRPGGGRYIRSEKEYANYTLSFEYLIQKGGNSGIGIRTPRLGWPSVDGMELQLHDLRFDEPLDREAPGSIYAFVPPLARADKSEQWNRVVIKADGWMISAWVNGELVQQCNTLHHPELKHRRLKGWIGLQDHGAWIRARNIRILEAPAGLGPAVWSKPPPPSAVTAILDRLINPQTVTLDDGITSGVATKSVSGNRPGGHVLAELTGPGAVVRVARGNNNNDDGRLTFYFDGQPEPRIDCSPADLWKEVPPLGEDKSPVLTYLPYRKSLRIVLRNARHAEYRIDYVRLPDGLPVATFDGRRSGFPRGWLPAVHRRQDMGYYGVHREYDRALRSSSRPKTIAPGKTAPLVHVDGTGIVEWMKLKADQNVLADDDLWLEVTIDGETAPAVSAPARYWFPGLVQRGNYHNYLLLWRDGWTNMLPMPFGDGITISATNRGSRPIADVAVEIAHEPATDQTRRDIAARPRLRGRFQPAEDGIGELVRQEGAGRWVGLVWATSKEHPIGIAELTVDGKPTPGWAAPNLDGLLGRGGDFRACLSGHLGPLAWRYMILAPVDFQKSLVLKTTGNQVGDRLALFYLKKK
jgi:hypothetical protein